MPRQRYEFTQGTSNKFWEIEVKGTTLTTTYGKIGSDGKSTTKSFDSAAAAKTAGEKLVGQKTAKGYTKKAATKKAATKKAATKKAATKKAATKKAATKKAATKKTVEDPWQRYEFVQGSSKKFWEVKVDGKDYSTRYGRIGSEGKVTTKAAKSPREALSLAKKLADAKAKKGYKLVGGELAGAPAVAASNPDLEAELLKDPNNVEAYLVYADWLQGQGDPRGELIMLQSRQQNKPKDKKLAKLVDQLIEEQRAHFWGEVADYLDMFEEVEWFMGFIKSAKVRTTYERAPGFADKANVVRFEEVLADFLDLPSARFLQNLSLGLQSPDGNNYAKAAQVIGKRKRPTLRSLFVGDFHSEETELNWSATGLMQPLYKAVPNLEHLTLRSGGIATGKISLPNLRSFTLISGELDIASLKQIAAAKWPKLETLSVQLGRNLSKAPIKELRPILTGKGLANLTDLGLTNGKWSNEICAALADAPILKQLQRLDLSMGTMNDTGADHIVQNADKFKHLDELGLWENFLSDKAIKQLKGVCKKVIFRSGKRNWRISVLPNGQKDDDGEPEYLYISAYE